METVLEMFNVEEKINELMNQTNDLKQILFSGGNIAIIVPSFDESGQFIKTDDEELYNAQKQDADRLAEYIQNNISPSNINIILDSDQLSEVLDDIEQPFDCVLLLHEFMKHERDFVFGEISDSQHAAAQVIKLY